MMEIRREWAMPSHNTFDIPPIRSFVEKYTRQSSVIIDPFARDQEYGTLTNDLNPNTKAQSHMKAVDWLAELSKQKVEADLVLFDPPYSLRQVKEVYEGVGHDFTMHGSQNAIRWTDEKSHISELVKIGGFVLSFGWNTLGMGLKHGFEIVEILIVCHGSGHNDTLCVAERKTRHQAAFLFTEEA